MTIERLIDLEPGDIAFLAERMRGMAAADTLRLLQVTHPENPERLASKLHSVASEALEPRGEEEPASDSPEVVRTKLALIQMRRGIRPDGGGFG